MKQKGPSQRELAAPQHTLDRSAISRALDDWSVLSYRVALVVAVCWLFAISVLAVSLSEPLFPRMMTVVFLGVPLSVSLYLAGWVFWALLKMLSAMFDPIARAIAIPKRGASRAAPPGRRYLIYLLSDLWPKWGSHLGGALRQLSNRLWRFSRVVSDRTFALRRASIRGLSFSLMVITIPIRLAAKVTLRFSARAG